MKSLHRTQALSAGAPQLVFVAQYDGRLVAPTTLGFQVFDVSTDEKLATPAQIFPPSGVQVVDLVAHAIGLGRYAATWTIAADAPLGRYRIRWTFQVPSALVTSPAITPWVGSCEETFEVLASPNAADASPQYCLVQDIRDELDTPLPDARVQALIRRVSRSIEQITGRFFEPRYLNLRADVGDAASRAFLVEMPIIAVERIDSPYLDDFLGVDFDLDLYRVANRHLSGVVIPDDRENPKIELAHNVDEFIGIRFRRTFEGLLFVRHIHVVGVFGYTEADGSPFGQTPAAIQHVTKLIVAREMPKLKDRDKREDAQQRWRITSERSRDMTVNLSEPRIYGRWYGDPEIDSILAQFMRPPQLGAA